MSGNGCSLPSWLTPTISTHAHLLGSDCVSKVDTAPSAILALVFFLISGYLGYKWFVGHKAIWIEQLNVEFPTEKPVYAKKLPERLLDQYYLLLGLAGAFFIWGMAFCIRAGIANTSNYNTNRVTVVAEQLFFIFGFYIFLDVFIWLSVRLAADWADDGQPTQYINCEHALLLLSFILSIASFANLPDIATAPPAPSSSKLRIAASFIPFILLLFNVGYLVAQKYKYTHIPQVGFYLLVLTSLFAVVPPFYYFMMCTIADSSSGIVTSLAFFYLSFGVFPILASLYFIGMPMKLFYFAPYKYLSIVPTERVLYKAQCEGFWMTDEERETLLAGNEKA